MHGEPYELARKSLILALKSLPKKCKFNIILFSDSTFEISDNMLEYNNKNINESIKKIINHGGGTDILRALELAVN